jgi:hypothetical protein
MAPADPFEGEPKPFESPIFLHSLDPILGASGEKSAAVAHEGAQGRLVESNEEERRSFHGLIVHENLLFG